MMVLLICCFAVFMIRFVMKVNELKASQMISGYVEDTKVQELQATFAK
jgi:hypothetical protein